MSNTKKIVSIVMALAMMLNIFAVVATAVEPAADPADYSVDVAFSTPKLKVYPGETFKITMTVGTNCYLGGLTLPIYFSNSVFESEGNVELVGSYADYASITSSVPVADAIVWPKRLNGASVTTALKKQYGAVMINAYADRNVGTKAAVLDPAEETITVDFTVAETATVGATGVIMLEAQALKTTAATTNPMTAYAYATSDVSVSADAIISMLNMTVDNASLTFEVIDKPIAQPADLSGLEAALEECNVSDSSANEYITSTWTNYYLARTAAEECLANSAGLTVDDQEGVDELEANLRAAYAALEAIKEESDYSKVIEALEKVPSEYTLKFCTEESVIVLQATIENINWNLAPSEQETIDRYVELIESAIAGLKPDESRGAAEAKIVFDNYEGEAGDTVNVSLYLGTNYYVESLSIPVFFDNTYFELVADSVSFDSTLAKSGWINYNLEPGDSIYTRTDPNDTTWSSIWADEANRSRYSALLFTWVQNGSDDNATSLEADIEEAFVTFQLKVKADAPNGDAKVFLCESFIKDASYMGGIFFVTRDLDESTLNVSATQPVGQTYVLTEAEATYVIGAELEAPTLVASTGSTAVIDTAKAGTYVINGASTEINGVVYGLAPDLYSIDGYVEATNEGSVVVTPVSGYSAIGTGAVIEVVRDEVVYETYVVIIFGDVNGDSAIDMFDVTMVDDYQAYIGDFNDFQLLAGDIVDIGFIDVFDLSALDAYANYYGDIDQTTGLFTE